MAAPTRHQVAPMRRKQQLAARRHQLDALFKTAGEIADRELQAHMARYLCILSSGFLENSVRVIYSLYATQQAGPNVCRYVDSNLADFQNPTADRIVGLTDGFSAEWKAELQGVLSDETRDAINSIVANRNAIAHGEWIGLTLGTLVEYFGRAVQILDLLESQCAGRPLTIQ